jgi:hypothetical protein
MLVRTIHLGLPRQKLLIRTDEHAMIVDRPRPVTALDQARVATILATAQARKAVTYFLSVDQLFDTHSHVRLTSVLAENIDGIEPAA